MATAFDPSIKRIEPSRSAESAIKRGKKLLSEKRFDEALAEFEGVLENGQATPFVHLAIGRIKFRQKDMDGALDHFQKAIKMDPTNAQAHLRTARIYATQGNLDRAKEDLQNVIRINPKSPIAYAGLGQIAMREKQPEQAIDQLKKALALNPRMLLARKRLALVHLESGNSDDAMVQLKSALRIKSDDPEVHAIMGRLHMKNKDYSAAQKEYNEALELDPKTNPVVHMGLAEAYIEGGQTTQAEQVLNDIPQREQFSPLLHKLWGDLYNAKGMHKEAVEEYRAASMTLGEDLGIEGIEEMDLTADDADDQKWEDLAQVVSVSAAEFLEKRRQQGDS